ncbi:hypothetical protein FB45DRAFT_791002 [Roridomyces roridus]|uniref:RBR-type E3 ubiquitin transferase n=1 Tax=Roridomyces roridus TaxID=1738132 RepID=A0AAD7BVH8_9AGAR|nr:hypothetical protein FB45DRAFT_791002 [Roridomyces roridus]
MSNSGRICKLYRQGRCSYGDRCKFSHQVQPRSPQTQEAVSTPATLTAVQGPSNSQRRPRPERGEIPCRAWRDGECPKGDKCWFGHDPEVREAERLRREHAATQAAEQAARDAARRAEIERQRVARQAEQEATERARHLELQARRADITRREAAHTLQHLILGSSLVTFGAGIAIQDIIPGFEVCRIQIKNLPRDAAAHEIKALFTQQGVDPTQLFLEGTRPSSDGTHLEASVITASEAGGAIAIGLEDIEFKQERLHFEVAESTMRGRMGNSARNSDTLTLSWRAPSTSVIATFDSEGTARAKAKVLTGTMCAGRRVRVEMNQPPPGFIRGPDWQRAVKITGLPTGVSPAVVGDFTGSGVLKFLKPISYDVETGLHSVRQVIAAEAGGGLKAFDVTRDDVDGNITVRARFDSWELAKRIENLFAGKRLPYLGNCTMRLRLPDPLQYVLSIPLQQYQAQKRVWDSFAEDAGDKTAYIRVFPIQNAGRMQIKVLGEDKKAVGSLKVRVENVAAGEMLESTYWHRSFKSATGSRFLASVFDSTGVYARADWKLCVVKLHGDSNLDRARQVVKAEVGRLDSLEFSVFLKQQSVRFFLQRGLAMLQETLGEDNASLTVLPRAKIVVRGGEEARHLLTKLIDESLEETPIQNNNTDQACPICYDEISHPVTLGCDHTYCMSCLRHYLSTADSFPLVCLGDAAHCEVLIPIPTFEKFLPIPQLHALLKTSFLRYIERHPQELKYCKTPDCTQVYRTNTHATALTCPSCFLSVCSSCDEEGHDGMSCEESRLQHDPGEQERRNDEWARDNGVKRCPACAVWIEKTEGCNHMTCKCGAHICWICVRIFGEGQIYGHLAEAHGGAFDVPAEEPRPVPARVFHAAEVPQVRWQGGLAPQNRLAPAGVPQAPRGYGFGQAVIPDAEMIERQREAIRLAQARQRLMIQERLQLEQRRRQEDARRQELAEIERRRQEAEAARRRDRICIMM